MSTIRFRSDKSILIAKGLICEVTKENEYEQYKQTKGSRDNVTTKAKGVF
jgi:hypothetical protein